MIIWSDQTLILILGELLRGRSEMILMGEQVKGNIFNKFTNVLDGHFESTNLFTENYA